MSGQPDQPDQPERRPDGPDRDQPDDDVVAVVTVHAEATVTHPDGSED